MTGVVIRLKNGNPNYVKRNVNIKIILCAKRHASIKIQAKNLISYFSKEGVQMANMHVKRPSSLIFRDTQLKNTMR